MMSDCTIALMGADWILHDVRDTATLLMLDDSNCRPSKCRTKMTAQVQAATRPGITHGFANHHMKARSSGSFPGSSRAWKPR
jgi:hypothetical protein